MDPAFAFVYGAAGLVAFATAGRIAVIRARLRGVHGRTKREVRQVRVVGPHARKLAVTGSAVFAVGAAAFALRSPLGAPTLVFGLVVLGFAVSNAVGFRMVSAMDPSWSTLPRSMMRDAALLAAAVVITGAAFLLGARDLGRLLGLVPAVACALAGVSIVRAASAPADPARDPDG